ncbi:MAG: tRNA lysidine(34) synthetase TilS [Clostridia bacterium]|nr:tRNA lysidine(34) synthetase TilS [Clostridia bacterium]
MLPFTLPPSLPCLVAFSGGADSRLLLELTVRALVERHGEEGRSMVLAAHLHHGIRGVEADRDLEFCQKVCKELGVELICDRADVPALADQWGESLETAARRVRYGFLRRVMARRGIPTLLTAHHADDNLETVLERLLRGSGTRGMGGIPPTRPLESNGDTSAVTLYRPLLEWTRRDILSACAEWGLDFVTDSTNLEDDCLRNRIRHTVIPALEEIAGRDAPQRAASRLSRISREDEDFLNAMAETTLPPTPSPWGNGLSVNELTARHPALSKRAISALYRGARRDYDRGSGSETLSTVHLEALLDLCRKGVPESCTPLPCGLEGRIREGRLYVIPTDTPDVPLPPDEPMLLGEGVLRWSEDVTVTVEKADLLLEPKQDAAVYASAIFPPDLPLPLTVRKRQAGDTILSHGMTKKLKKLLNEKDIALYIRDRLPLICLSDGSPEGIPLWYPSVAFRDGYPSPTEGPCIRITVYRSPLAPRKNDL